MTTQSVSLGTAGMCQSLGLQIARRIPTKCASGHSRRAGFTMCAAGRPEGWDSDSTTRGLLSDTDRGAGPGQHLIAGTRPRREICDERGGGNVRPGKIPLLAIRLAVAEGCDAIMYAVQRVLPAPARSWDRRAAPAPNANTDTSRGFSRPTGRPTGGAQRSWRE